jgi:undecaprenyl-phosphate 4-deoxy-4-formamido-L-arabinose transferase
MDDDLNTLRRSQALEHIAGWMSSTDAASNTTRDFDCILEVHKGCGPCDRLQGAGSESFRAVRTGVRVAFADYMGPDLLLDVLLGWGTTRFCAVDVVHAPRKRGKSNYTATRLFEMGLLALTAYSTKPLRFASWVGFDLTGFGVSVLTYVVILAVFFGSVPGFPFLASLISIFSGAQLFALGLFGEYLTRIFNRALGRPTYVIRETYSTRESPGSKQD